MLERYAVTLLVRMQLWSITRPSTLYVATGATKMHNPLHAMRNVACVLQLYISQRSSVRPSWPECLLSSAVMHVGHQRDVPTFQLLAVAGGMSPRPNVFASDKCVLMGTSSLHAVGL